MPTRTKKPTPIKPPKGPRSDLEKVLQLHMRAYRLPEPTWGYRFAKEAMNREWEFDGCWFLPNVEAVRYGAWCLAGIAFEVEGGVTPFYDKQGVLRQGGHNTIKGYEQNAEKYNAANLLGWLLVRVTRRMIDDGRAVETIAQALRQFGVVGDNEGRNVA